ALPVRRRRRLERACRRARRASRRGRTARNVRGGRRGAPALMASRSAAFGFRVEAGAGIGIGHFMRCYAFAQTCRRLGHRATFLSAGDAPEGRTRLAAARITAVKLSASHPDRADAAETVRWARARRGSWLVVDGYRFDADYQRR